MKPSRLILGAVYKYLNKEVGRTYAEITDFFGLPTRGSVAGCIRDLPAPRKGQPTMSDQPHVKLRSCVFDIETTNFNAESNADILVCTSFLPLDTGEVETVAITYDEMMSDTRDYHVLLRTLDYIKDFDIVIGHNIAGFDLNWLTTRMLFWDIPFPDAVFYYDTYSAVKRIGVKTWKNLGNLGAFFNLDGEKTRVFRPDWMNVLSPSKRKHEKAMRDIIYHCEEDVKMNRALFDILYPRDKKQRNLKYYDKWM